MNEKITFIFSLKNIKKFGSISWGDIFICIAATLVCSFYTLERETSQKLISLINVFAFLSLFIAWIYSEFKNGVLKRYSFFIFTLVFFLLPLFCIITTSEIRDNNRNIFIINEFAKLFSRYALTTLIAKFDVNPKYDYILANLTFLVIVSAAFFYGRFSRVKYDANVLKKGLILKLSRKILSGKDSFVDFFKTETQENTLGSTQENITLKKDVENVKVPLLNADKNIAGGKTETTHEKNLPEINQSISEKKAEDANQTSLNANDFLSILLDDKNIPQNAIIIKTYPKTSNAVLYNTKKDKPKHPRGATDRPPYILKSNFFEEAESEAEKYD